MYVTAQTRLDGFHFPQQTPPPRRTPRLVPAATPAQSHRSPAAAVAGTYADDLTFPRNCPLTAGHSLFPPGFVPASASGLGGNFLTDPPRPCRPPHPAKATPSSIRPSRWMSTCRLIEDK